ncbi:UNVERIFIED_CONTAM: Transcription factor GTE4 [Sesamum angustifolium]|uniref:Transcription factor GTE4 n=1 Tax=Sesamum angustifolium TaxID=2727405 RepID=A0AAW2PCU7_9LAMI
MLGGGNEGFKEDEKLGERKVYSRRSFKGLETSKSSSNLLREQQQPKVVSDGGFLRQENKVWISLPMKSKHEALELKRKLEGERDMVRTLMRKIEANEGQKNAADRFENRDGDKVAVEVGPARMLKPLNQLSVSVYENSKGVKSGKEKRTPKANKYKSEFCLRRIRFLQLKANQNWYKSPLEFAEDVRLTFRNAMTYNPKEQDVYVMAEQLSKVFEDKWALIEADYMRELKLTADLDVTNTYISEGSSTVAGAG